MANNKNQIKSTEFTREDVIGLLRAATVFFLGVLLLFFFFGWCYIRNNKVGVEVGMNGWNFICLSFTWNFRSTNTTLFGDVAVPFNYYAHELTVTLTIITMIAFYLTIALVVLAVLNLIKVRAIITKLITILAIANAISLLVAFIIALIMNGSDILPEYCSGNPECSIRSLIIIPSLVSVLIAILNGILSKKLVVKEE